MSARQDSTPEDWDQVSRAVAKAYFPHELTRLGSGRSTRSTLQTLDLGPVLLGYVGWGGDVQVACDYPNAYEINMPISGHLESRGRHGAVTSVPGHPVTHQPLGRRMHGYRCQVRQRLARS